MFLFLTPPPAMHALGMPSANGLARDSKEGTKTNILNPAASTQGSHNNRMPLHLPLQVTKLHEKNGHIFRRLPFPDPRARSF